MSQSESSDEEPDFLRLQQDGRRGDRGGDKGGRQEATAGEEKEK